jgi:hypothetical protein
MNDEERLAAGNQRGPVVFIVRRETSCGECGEELGPGRWIRLEGGKALCMACADLDHLEFLPSGNAAVTRRAGRYSKLKLVVVKWSRARKRYERQGMLVEEAAIERAEQESLADADVRARRQVRQAERRALEDQEYIEAFAEAVRVHYPGCPSEEAQQIAGHACRKHSGRVGRSAAAKAFEPSAVRFAVTAHVRHAHTPYDELLCRYGDRESARGEIAYRVAEILMRWQVEDDRVKE